MLGFNDTSSLVSYFVSPPREREKRDRRDCRGEREGLGRNRKMNESEETEGIKTFPFYLYLPKDSRACPTVNQSQLDALVTKGTRHLCLTQPPPLNNNKDELKLVSV